MGMTTITTMYSPEGNSALASALDVVIQIIARDEWNASEIATAQLIDDVLASIARRFPEATDTAVRDEAFAAVRASHREDMNT
jgi:hypothetical protein